MEGYGLSEEELFASSLHNFTWENSFEQVGDTGPVSVQPAAAAAAAAAAATSTFLSSRIKK